MLGIQSEEAAYHLQKSQLVTNLPVFVFHKMLKEGTKPADCPLMVLTKYIDNSNHWKTVNGKKVERFMETNEFVAGVSYTCMIVITNCVAHPASRGGHGSDSAGIVPSIHSQVLGERSEDNRCLQHLHDELFVRSTNFPKVGDFEHLPAHIIDSTKATILAVASPSFIHSQPSTV